MAHVYDGTMPAKWAHTDHHPVSGYEGARSEFVSSSHGGGSVHNQKLDPQHGTVEESGCGSNVLLNTRVGGGFLTSCCTKWTYPLPDQLLTWPAAVKSRWRRINIPKNRHDLGVLSWNTNGRLDLRGCREGLIRNWARKGFVDIALIQETLKKSGSSLYDVFGPDWWNISSWAVSRKGRGSGGCTIFGQPSLFSYGSVTEKGGRISGTMVGDGLVLNVYFPTNSRAHSVATNRKEFSDFVDKLISVVSTLSIKKPGTHDFSWILCGTDTNSHFKGSGPTPRQSDDPAAVQVRRFMKKFDLVSVAEELCPDHATRINTRGHQSCIDTFLVSRWLFERKRITMYEVIDWIETGSDHSPLYIRVKVYPTWVKKTVLPRRRILKASGLLALRNKMENGTSRDTVVENINRAFSSFDWSLATNREDMDFLWNGWVEAYGNLVEKLVGTRPARETTWGRKFDPNLRLLCKRASISRSWYILASRATMNCDELLERWVNDRKAFVEAWEESNKQWLTNAVIRAVKNGDVATWRLLSGISKRRFRPLVAEDGMVLTDPDMISKRLEQFHKRSMKENSVIPPGDFKPVNWQSEFIPKNSPQGDLVLEISDELVLANLKKLKISTVPDNILPVVLKLFFGRLETVIHLAELIRAVVKTRIFPTKGKLARQSFVWKGKGEKNSLGMCRTITMANSILKLSESCVKVASLSFWKKAGFPCSHWGQFFGALESLYIWQSTVECYIRRGLRPETTLTDISKAFDRVCIKLYERKLFDYGLPRQLIELVIEFISDLRVHLNWGDVVTDTLERGNIGVPQGSMEGMWNFSVYSDNIQCAMTKAVPGIVVGGQVVRDVVYADDDTPVNPNPSQTNLALEAISSQGTYNCYKFKSSKCKVIGADSKYQSVYMLGKEEISCASNGRLLGAIINGRGIDALKHVMTRRDMVKGAIMQIKAWRSLGLSASISVRKLFIGKILPRFAFAFALLHLPKGGPVQKLICEVLDRVLSRCSGWTTPKRAKLNAGIWNMIFGFPSAYSYLCQEKLLLAGRLFVGNHKAGRIFRGLFGRGGGSFETDVAKLLNEWCLSKLWKGLTKTNYLVFKKKVKSFARKQWSCSLEKDGKLGWIYHNHCIYSGNMPNWADWTWPHSKDSIKFKKHFVFLVSGLHPAGGNKAVCLRSPSCADYPNSVYQHHFFDCPFYIANRLSFRDMALKLYGETKKCHSLLSSSMLESVLSEPSPRWFGLLDHRLFKPGVRLRAIHELHRILTIASIFSWGRFYALPQF